MSEIAVHYHRDFSADEEASLRARLDPNIRLSTGRFSDPATADVPPFEILIEGVPAPELLASSPRLHTLIIPWAGLAGRTRRVLEEFPHLAVHNLHYNNIPVAESALMLLLAAAKRVTYQDAALRRGDWRPRYEDPPRQQMLYGKTVLILGYGAIGRRVGELCGALGMDILATRRTVTAPEQDGPAVVYPDAALDELLRRAHGVVICLPLTPETRGLLDAAALARLPRGALLVNVGRGAVVEQQALYDALSDGQLGAAGLDVWYNYPTDRESRTATFPADVPLHELTNVVMTPHSAAHGSDAVELVFDHLAPLLNAAARGEDMPNRVDVERGY